jgi:CheY-like chemotaxis protein
LTAILGNVSLANMYIEQGSEAAERIAAAEKACQRAQKLTHQLLTFSKGGQPVKGLVSIPEVIEESANFVLQGSNVRALFDFASDLPHVEADAGQIGQVMQNLALNAVQAMPDGGELRIRARRVTLLQDKPPLSAGTYVEVSVADDGCGIPAENLLRIFDPFFTTKSKGSGLGLATTYSIIQRHHGHLEVESEIGVGSTFRFYLPGSDLSLQPTQEDEWLGTHGSGRILLMDDEPALCDLARAGLLEYGFEVSTATGGSEAVRLFYEAQRAGKPYDAVVLDLTIRGDMGGRETLQRLFTLDPGVKAIVASGYSNDPVMSRHRDYGFSGMIAKPFRMVDLARTIVEVLKSEAG